MGQFWTLSSPTNIFFIRFLLDLFLITLFLFFLFLSRFLILESLSMLEPRLWLFVGREIRVVVHHLFFILTGVDFSPKGCLRTLVYHVVLKVITITLAVSYLESGSAFHSFSASPVGFLLSEPLLL